MIWGELPLGMMRLDDMIRILRALQSTGGCDERTLAIVAEAIGVECYLKPTVTVEQDRLILPEAKGR